MEVLELLGGLPAAAIPVVLVIYYSNQNNLKWMAERKELAEAVLAERAAWGQERRELLDRQFALQDRLTESLAVMRSEDHALRNKLTEFMLKLEAFIIRVENFMAGASGGRQ